MVCTPLELTWFIALWGLWGQFRRDLLCCSGRVQGPTQKAGCIVAWDGWLRLLCSSIEVSGGVSAAFFCGGVSCSAPSSSVSFVSVFWSITDWEQKSRNSFLHSTWHSPCLIYLNCVCFTGQVSYATMILLVWTSLYAICLTYGTSAERFGLDYQVLFKVVIYVCQMWSPRSANTSIMVSI